MWLPRQPPCVQPWLLFWTSWEQYRSTPEPDAPDDVVLVPATLAGGKEADLGPL